MRKATKETDPRGITKRLYAMAESSLRGKRTLRVDGTLRAEHTTISNRSRHPIEI